MAAERSVWALGVVVVDVDAQDAVELARSEDQQPVQAFGSCGPHEALGVRVGLRRPERCLDHLDAVGAKDLVEAGDELRVAVADQELDVVERAGEAEVARLLGDPAAVRVRGRACEVDAAGLQLDEEQHVVAAQQRGLDGEEVASDDARRLRAQELTPARPRTPWRRSKAGACEQPANRARRNRHAELAELAGDPLVAPTRVLARQPQHELARSGVDRRAPWPRVGIGPPAPHELAVPAQQRLRRNEQPLAACGRQQPTRRGKQRAVTRAQLRTLDLTTQDRELMAQHEQLDVLDVNAPAAADQQLQQRDEREVDEGHEHPAILSRAHATRDSSQIRVLAPFRVLPSALVRVRACTATIHGQPTRNSAVALG